MSKQTGLGDNLYVNGVDLSGDIGSLGRIGGGPAVQEVTGINKFAIERIGVLRDGSIDYSAFFNPEGAHPILSALPAGDVIISYWRGTALGGASAHLVAKQLNYDGSRGDDGAYTFAGSTQGNGYGLEWGTSLTAGKRTDITGTNGASVDFGTAPATFGLQAYLHVFAVTGTSVTVKLQQSSDNGVGDAWTDVVGGAFTAATGVTSQRIQTARDQTVERYLRVVTTGVFTQAVVAVAVNRNEVETKF